MKNKYQEALKTLSKYAHESPNVGWALIHEENIIQELVDKETIASKSLTDLIIKFVNLQVRMVHETNSRRGITKRSLLDEAKILKDMRKVANIDIEAILKGIQ